MFEEQKTTDGAASIDIAGDSGKKEVDVSDLHCIVTLLTYIML